MMLNNILVPRRGIDVGIYFSGGDTLMSEHLLNHAKVCSMLDQMGGKRMTEGVRRYLLTDTGKKGLSLDHLEHRLTAERLSEPVEEHDIVCL